MRRMSRMVWAHAQRVSAMITRGMNRWHRSLPRQARGLSLMLATGLGQADAALALRCVGDCNGRNDVTVDELITGVNIALGNTLLGQCAVFDVDGSGEVTVNELIAAVNNALVGCPAGGEGVLLEGAPDTLAVNAVHDLDREGGSPSSELRTEGTDRTLIRTRIELGFTPGATVGQVNGLLDSVGGRIVMMLDNVPILLVQIPDPGGVDSLNALVGRVGTDPIVRFVRKAYLSRPDVLPDNFFPAPVASDFSKIDHQLAVRAAAAWNARKAIRAAQQPTVVIQDYFGGGPPVTAPGGGFDVRIDEPGDFASAGLDEHGYHVAGIIAASFGGTTHCSGPLSEPSNNAARRDCATGMFPGTVPLRAVDSTGPFGEAAADDKTILILKSLVAQGVNGILNTSLGNSCRPANDTCVPSAAAVEAALVWIEKVRLSGLEERFLHLTSAGNVESDFPDAHDASENSAYSAAALSPSLQVGGAVPNLTNVLVIENGINTPTPPYEIGCLSNISFIGGHLSAIGTDVWSLIDAATRADDNSGTSMSTPQVAGLASYVWALAPELSPQQVAGVLQATARRDFAYSLRGVDDRCYGAAVQPAPTIDAYDAVLSLDAAALPERTNSPVRLAILDVDDDGDFDGDDLFEFVTMYIDPQTGQPRVPDQTDYSRWDLNGNGKTGGDETGHFDLDRVSSTQYGVSQYGTVTQPIEGVPIAVDETRLTDLDILCYYAYSALFTGAGGVPLTAADRQARVELLDPISHCMAVGMEVVFPTIIAPGTNTLLVVRVLNERSGRAPTPIAGMHIELTPSGGTVDDFAGVTDSEGFFQTRARLSSGSQQMTIDVTAGGQAGGPVVAQGTVRATVSAGPDIDSIFLDSSANPGPFVFGIQPTNGASMQIDGTLEAVTAAMNAALAGAHHVGQMMLGNGNGPPASFRVSAPSVDVGELLITDEACGSTMEVTLGKATRVRMRGCRSTITAVLSDIVGDGNRISQVEISGTESSFDVSAGGIEGGVVVASGGVPPSHLRIGIHSASIMGGAAIAGCADCAIAIDGTVSGSLSVGGNTNLSLGPLTLGDVFGFSLQGNNFMAFGGITGGDIIGPVSISRGHASIVGNTGLALSAIGIGDVAGDLTIKNNHGFNNADAVAFAGARMIGGAVRIENNEGP